MATKVAESSEYSNYFPNKSFQKTFVCLFLYKLVLRVILNKHGNIFFFILQKVLSSLNYILIFQNEYFI